MEVTMVRVDGRDSDSRVEVFVTVRAVLDELARQGVTELHDLVGDANLDDEVCLTVPALTITRTA